MNPTQKLSKALSFQLVNSSRRTSAVRGNIAPTKMRKHPHIAATIGRTDRCAEHPPPEQVGTIGGAEAAENEASGATDGGAGNYIVFEGAEGSGKSTQAARLATTLDAVLTRETGGTDIGARLRAILHDTTNAHLDDRAEALLAAADRAQHLAEVVRP